MITDDILIQINCLGRSNYITQRNIGPPKQSSKGEIFFKFCLLIRSTSRFTEIKRNFKEAIVNLVNAFLFIASKEATGKFLKTSRVARFHLIGVGTE